MENEKELTNEKTTTEENVEKQVVKEEKTTEQPQTTTEKSTSEQPQATTEKSTSEQPQTTTEKSTSEQPQATTEKSTSEQPQATTEKNTSDNIKGLFNNLKDSTSNFQKTDIEAGKGMGVLSYIIPLIPFFAEKKNKFVVYHAKQGMNLFIVSIAYIILYAILAAVIKVDGNCGYGYLGNFAESLGITCEVTPWWITWPLNIIGLGISILAIMGIVYVCQGKAKELPIINKIRIFK